MLQIVQIVVREASGLSVGSELIEWSHGTCSDQLETGGHITFANFHAGLSKLESDPLVFLP